MFSDMISENNLTVACTNYIYQLDTPIKVPIFSKFIGEEMMFDILFDRIRIYLALDIDKMIELFNKEGYEAKWLTRKETNRYLDTKPQYQPLILNNKAIRLKIKDNELHVGSHMVTKILHDNILPSSFVGEYSGYLQSPIEKK
jgi:hypothetical protein